MSFHFRVDYFDVERGKKRNRSPATMSTFNEEQRQNKQSKIRKLLFDFY
ncbi:MAG: hypothetical protein ACI94Y_001637 [Maribacter sp.]|jgi:hypothetical protein